MGLVMRKSVSLMKLYRNILFSVASLALLCTSVGSSALSLGRAKGVVLLGQPLRLTIPIQLEPEEESAALCLGADVFYGETRQDAGRVEVINESSAQPHSANAYVRVSANVDEPVVTVYMRAGCDQKASRRYVLLADPAQSATAPSKPDSMVPQAFNALDTQSPTIPRPSKRASAVVVEPKADTRVPVRLKAPAHDLVVRRPHLKLVPVDLQEDRDPALRFSNDMLLGDSGDLQRRAQAAAMWQSLNATPQDMERADSRRQSLEKNVSALQDTTAKNRLLLQELAGRLERAESERYSNPVVFGLFGVLTICILGLAYAWTRVRRLGRSPGPWWGNDGADDLSEMAESGVQAASGQADGGPTLPPEPQNSPVVSTIAEPELLVTGINAMDVDLGPGDPQAQRHEQEVSRAKENSPAMPSKTTQPLHAPVDFANSLHSTTRAVNMQEMLDVRQQAEFFIALGQHEEAITLLRTIIDAGSDANPLVYLDLLKILHDLGRKVEFDYYRTGFTATFSGHIPGYAEFNERGGDLEAYPEVCRHICAHWPSEEVIHYIEESLIRTVDQDQTHGFSLQAFRDLLMLHGVARRIVSSFESGFLPFSAAKTVPAETGPGFPDHTQPVSALADSNAHLSVDLDLSEPPGNLIDFDPDDFLPLTKAQPEPPTSG